MARRERRRFGGLVGLFFTLLATCSSAQPLTAREYFPALEAELATLDQSTRDVTDRFARQLQSELDRLLAGADPETPADPAQLRVSMTGAASDAMAAIIEAHAGNVEVFDTRIAELAPPQAQAERHRELVDAMAQWAASGAGTVEQLREASSLDELADVLRTSSFAAAQLRVDTACQALRAEAAPFGVDLSCPGTSVVDITPPAP